MPKGRMPAAHFGARIAHVRAEVAPPSAFDRWHPEFMAAAASDDDSPFSIDVLDVIGENWDGTGMTAARMGGLLRMAGDRPVVVNINSPGGDVFEGLTIYNMLRAHSAQVTVRVLGLAASAASIIAMGGDRVEIAKAAFMMIHNTWVFAIGDRNELTTIAGQLAAFDEVMADLYAARTGLDAGRIATMMDRETWIAGKAAVADGWADDLLPADAVATNAAKASAGSQKRALAKFDAVAARAGLTRSEARGLRKEITGMPSAAEDGTPRAAEGLKALRASFKSFLGNTEI